MGQNYYSKFLFTASGLDKVLSEFSATAARIKSESATIGKMNFTGMNAALPALERIEASITTISGSMRMLASAELNAGAGMDKIAVGATRASTTTKSVSTSMAQLATTAGTATVAAGRTTGALTAMGAAGKSAFSGVVTGAERAIGAIASVGAAAGRTTIQMSAMAAIPFAGLRGIQGLFAGSVLGSMASTLLNPVNVASAGVGYGIYSGMNLQKSGTMAAGKSGASGDAAKAIERIVWDSAQSFMGQYAYTPNQIGEMEVSYAAMGGNLTDLGTTRGVVKNALDFAQAVNMELAPAMELLYSQALNWSGFQTMQGPGATQAIQDMGDALTVLSNQTRLNPEDLNTALKSSTAVAKVSGMDQNQLYAAVGSLSQLGREPQQADSDVRRLIMRLTPSYNALQQQQADELGLWVDKAGKQKDLSALNEGLKEIGLTYRDISLETNNGDLVKSITKITDAMNAAGWDQLTQESFLKTQLGIQGTTPFYLLGQQSGQDIYYNLLEKLLNKAGIAATGAKTQLDELWGSLGKLKSNVVGTANSLGLHFMPATKRFVDFLNESAIPGLNKLGSALIAGDWKGAASVLGDAYDFIKEKGVGAFEELSTSLMDSQNWADWGDIIKGTIGTAQDDLLALSKTFSDFMTGGGAGNLLEGASSWVKNILSAWNKEDLSAIWNNLSTGLDAAWSQSVEWLRGEIDGINWESVGTTLGEALESGATWAIENIGKLPWASITTAVTNALTGIVATIDWSKAITITANVAVTIGQMIYNGISAANLGILFQNWAISFVNSMKGAISDVSTSIAGLMLQVGAAPSTVAGAFGTAGEVAKTAYNAGKTVWNFNLEEAAKNDKTDYSFPALQSDAQKALESQQQQNAQALDYNKEDYFKYEGSALQKFLSEPTKTISDWINSDPIWGSSFSGASGVISASKLSAIQKRQSELGFNQVSEENYDFIKGIKTSNQKEVESFYSFMQTDVLPEYEEGVTECLQYYGQTKNDYKEYVADTLDKSDDNYWKDLNLVNLPKNYHFLAGLTPSGEDITDPTQTYLFDPETANYKGTIKENRYNEDIIKLITKYRLNPNNIENIRSEKGYRFIFDKNKNITTENIDSEPYNPTWAYGAAQFGMGSAYVPGKGYVSTRSKEGSTGDLDKSVKFVKSGLESTAKSLGIGDKSDSDSKKSTAKSTEKSSLSLDSIDNTLKGISSQSSVTITGKDAKGNVIEPQTYAGNQAESIIKELLGKGYKISGVEIKDQFGNLLSSQNQASDKTVKALEDSAPVINENSKVVQTVSESIKSLPPELQKAFSNSIPDYKAIANYMKDEYGASRSAKDWENFDQYDDSSTSDLITGILAGMFPGKQIPLIVPDEIKKATEETAKNTKKIGTWSDPWVQFKTIKDAFSNSISEVTKSTQSTTSAVQSESDRAATQAKVDDSFQRLFYSTICDIEGFLTPERVSPLGTISSPTGGMLVRVGDTFMTKDEYEATIGVSISGQQMNAAAKVGKVPFYGTITPEDIPEILEDYEKRSSWSQENIRQSLLKYQSMYEYDLGLPTEWGTVSKSYAMTLGGQSRKPDLAPILLGSLANKDNGVEVSVEPVVNSEPIDTLKSTADAGAPYNVKVTSNAEAVAAQLNSLGGSTTFTVFVNTVNGGGQTTNFSKGTSTLSDGSIFTFNSFKTPAVPSSNSNLEPILQERGLIDQLDLYYQKISTLFSGLNVQTMKDQEPRNDVVKVSMLPTGGLSEQKESSLYDNVAQIDRDLPALKWMQSFLNKDTTDQKEFDEKLFNCIDYSNTVLENIREYAKSTDDTQDDIWAQNTRMLEISGFDKITGNEYNHAEVAYSPSGTWSGATTYSIEPQQDKILGLLNTDPENLATKNVYDILKDYRVIPASDGGRAFNGVGNDNLAYYFSDSFSSNRYERAMTTLTPFIGVRSLDEYNLADRSNLKLSPNIDSIKTDLSNAKFDAPLELNLKDFEEKKSYIEEDTKSSHKVTSNAEAVAAQLNSLGGSTTFTVYVNTVNGGGQTTNFSKGTSTLSDGSIFTFNSFKTPAVPAFADGGYTGSYEGLANIHPEEIILNKAQQRNVASTMRGSGNNIQVSISLDLRGSTITGDSAEVFAEKIATSVKEQLQGEMYR